MRYRRKFDCVGTSLFLPTKIQMWAKTTVFSGYIIGFAKKIYMWAKSCVVVRTFFKLKFYRRLFQFMVTYCMWAIFGNIIYLAKNPHFLYIFMTTQNLYLWQHKIYIYGDINSVDKKLAWTHIIIYLCRHHFC